MRSVPPPSITRAEAAAVLRAYSLGRVLFVRPGAGTANPAAIVATPRGEFFLKRRNPRYASRQQLIYDHAVIHHLLRAGLPVTPPIRTPSGSRWLEHHGAVYELYPLVKGDQHEPGRVAQVEAAGRTLAAFHRATSGFRAPDTKPLAARLFDPRNALRILVWARDRLASGPSQEGDLRRVLDLMELAQALITRLPDETYWSLPQCILHGDYHPANLKYQGDEVCGIFDFDWVMPGPRMVDVADGLVFFCGVRLQPTAPGDIRSLTQAFRLDKTLIAAFGRGYAQGVTPTAPELRALPDLMRARWLYCRTDAMERKIPDEDKLTYLLEDVEVPLQEVQKLEEWISGGQWLDSG